MSESITLPKSGLVLTWDVGFRQYRISTAGLLILVDEQDDDRLRRARFGDVSTYDTLDRLIPWLDARVLALRSALLPRDAVERVAKWLVEEFGMRYGRPWDEAPECQRDDARSQARAVLAALGVDHA